MVRYDKSEFLEVLPVPAYLWDIPTQKFFAANRLFCALLGYSHNELLELDWRRLVAPEDTPAALRAIEVGAEMQAVVWHWIKKDGNLIEVTLASRRMRLLDEGDNMREVYIALIISSGRNSTSANAAFPQPS